MAKINWKILIISFVIVYLISFLGSLFTDTEDWYESVKPSITPPNYIFPIVWNILFFLIALSLYIAWTKTKNKKPLLIAFGLNLILNLLWSVIFFGLKQPILSFIELILLWLSIIFLIKTTSKINKTSSYLLIPYLLWVSFAGVLNFLIVF